MKIKKWVSLVMTQPFKDSLRVPVGVFNDEKDAKEYCKELMEKGAYQTSIITLELK